MTNTEQLFSQLNQADLLPIQKNIVEKLEKKLFEIAKKSTYEPLYALLKTLFITEYPNFNLSNRTAQIFFENDVQSVQSAYRDFQSYGLLFCSYFSNDIIKKEIYYKITQNANPVVLQKRIARCKEETLLKTQLDAYKKLNNSTHVDEVFIKGFSVIIAALQVLQYLPEDQSQIDRMNLLIEEIVFRLKGILPNIKLI